VASRGMENSGGELHIRMVKEAVKRIVDRFATMNRIMIQFEPWEQLKMTFHESRYEKFMQTPQIDFRPDIMLTHVPVEKRKAQGKGFMVRVNYSEEKVWESIEDSSHVVFECETRPKAIFRNHLKIAYYTRMTDERKLRNARLRYAFVLVVPKGSKLPDDTAPFDEVWVVDV